MRTLFCLSFLVLMPLLACKKDRRLQSEKDEDTIKEYVTSHGLNATRTASGLYIVIDKQGTGSSCSSYSSVKVSYKGYLANGSVFDESDSIGVKFNLQNVISGWTEGIPYFNEGGSGKLLIPSALGYGEKSSTDIPANSVLIFDIKLIDVL